ncbi:MAG TPA: NAD-dependent epimerase/dehydratase family protein [Bacteroidia bacterium]|nr:NAD-dependent epimerase/dehydratase family protein [Bacteroidia bacterium]
MILLTGGTGFLGQFIIRELLARGEKVRLLVRNPSKVQAQPGVELVEGDVLDTASLEVAFEGVDSVIHGAAVVSFWPRRRQEMTRINVEGTANMVDFALEAKVKKFVHISSIAALGRISGAPKIDETSKWVKSPLNSAYGRSKYLAELEVYRGVEEGLQAVICNPGVIVGPGHWDQGSPKLFGSVAKGLKFYNPGQTGFVSVQDVARATVALLFSDLVDGERFVLVSENMLYKDLFGLVAKSLGVKGPSIVPPAIVSAMAGRLSEWVGNLRNREPIITKETTRSSRHIFNYDGSKITRTIGFQYGSLADCIAETGAQYRKEHGN